jgi:hypothetical protein
MILSHRTFANEENSVLIKWMMMAKIGALGYVREPLAPRCQGLICSHSKFLAAR